MTPDGRALRLAHRSIVAAAVGEVWTTVLLRLLRCLARLLEFGVTH